MRVDVVPPASGGGGAQSNQTLGLYATSNTTGASSSSTFDARSITFQGAGIASVGYSNGSVVVSVPSGGGAGDGVNILAAGTQTAATTGTVLFNNSNGITFGMSNSSVITASHNGLTSQSNQAFSASGGSSAFQTLNFANSNGVTFSNSNGSLIASYTVPTVTSLTVSDNATSGTVGRLAFTNLNGVTLSLSTGAGGSHTIVGSHNALTTARASTDAIGLNTAQSNVTWTVNSSGLSLDARGYAGTGTSGTNISLTLNSNGLAASVGSQTNQSLGLYAVSNTTGASSSSTFDARSVSFQGAGVASVGYSNGSVVISVPSGGGAGDGVNIIAAGGSTANTTGTIVFSNSNGVSFGLNGATVTASHNGLTTARASNDGIGLATAQTNVTWTVNSAGLSLNAGGYAGTQTGATNISLTLNSNGLSASVTQSNQALSAGNGSFAFQTASFSNANGISFSTSAGSAIVASHNGLTTARASNDAIGLNTAQSNVTWTVNSSGLSLDARGYAGTGTSATNASITLNSNGLAISVAAPGGGGAVNFSGGTTSNNLQTIVFSNSNGVSFGLNGSTMTASHNGLTTARASNDAIGLATAQSNVTWTVNSAGLSLDARNYAGTGTSATNASVTLNSNGLQISVAAPGGGGAVNFSAGTTSNNLQTVVFSNSNGVSFGLNGSTITASAGGTMSAMQLPVPWYQSTAAAQANGSLLLQPFMPLQNFAFSAVLLPLTISVSSSSNSSHAGVISLLAGVYSRNASTLSLITSGSVAYQWSNTSNNSMASITGERFLSIPLQTTLSSGEYWVGVLSRTSSTNANWFSASYRGAFSYSFSQARDIGQVSNASIMLYPGLGALSASTTAIPNSVAFSEVRTHGRIMYLQLVNYTV